MDVIIPIQFFRFKNKTLTLVSEMYPQDTKKMIGDIKYRKLFKCIQKDTYYQFKERILSGHTDAILSIIKLSKTQIATGSRDDSVKIWDLPTGKCL